MSQVDLAELDGGDCRSGPARGGSNLRKRVTFSQIGAPSRTDIADVSPCLSDLGTPLAFDESQGSFKTRR